jgi:hypothetical protein
VWTRKRLTVIDVLGSFFLFFFGRVRVKSFAVAWVGLTGLLALADSESGLKVKRNPGRMSKRENENRFSTHSPSTWSIIDDWPQMDLFISVRPLSPPPLQDSFIFYSEHVRPPIQFRSSRNFYYTLLTTTQLSNIKSKNN